MAMMLYFAVKYRHRPGVKTDTHGGHSTEDYPTLLVGKAQGKLRTGQHLTYPVGTPVANLYVEMLNCLDSRVRSFGDSHTARKQAFDGRLPGLVSKLPQFLLNK